MTFSPIRRLAFLTLVAGALGLPASTSAVAAAANSCKNLSQQKMAACQLKAKADLKKPDKKLKPGTKPLITPLDILMFVL